MLVKKISPRGYCYGVVDAMKLAQQAALNPELPRPIHILGMIVHNAHVTREFENLGVITVDGPDRLEALERILVRAQLVKGSDSVGIPSDPTYVTVNP